MIKTTSHFRKVLFIFLGAIVLLTPSLSAQSTNWMWGATAGGNNNLIIDKMATDNAGNFYVFGRYFSKIAVFGSTSLINSSDYNGDLFLIKVNSAGLILWARSVNGTGDEVSTDVAVDATGNAYITGSTTSTSVSFGTAGISGISGKCYFLTKYDTNGNVIWAKLAATGVVVNSLAIDNSGNSFLTGDFGNIGGMFLTKYDGNGNFVWSKTAGNSGSTSVYGNSVTCDTSGNIYVAGSFIGGDATIGGTTLTNQGGYDIYFIKYDSQGNVVYVKSAGSSNHQEAKGIGVDGSGNIIICGNYYSGNATFNGTTLTANYNTNTFILQFNNSGNQLWTYGMGGSDIPKMKISSDNTIYIVNSFSYSGNITIGGTTIINTYGNGVFYIAKFSSAGSFQWAKGCTGNGYQSNYNITTDNSNQILFCYKSSSTSLELAGVTIPHSTTSNSTFISRINSSGSVIGTINIGGGLDNAQTLAIDEQGNRYCAGNFNNYQIVFGNRSCTNYGTNDYFLVKYNSLGNVVWATNGGSGYGYPFVARADYVSQIKVDAAGNCYVVGYFSSSKLNFWVDTLVNQGGYDMFIVKYNTNGGIAWAKSAGGTGNDEGMDVVLDSLGNCYVLGNYLSSNLNTGVSTLSNSSGVYHNFVIKYNSAGNPVSAAGFGGSNGIKGNALGIDVKNNLYIGGYFYNGSNNYDWYLSKVNSNLAAQWMQSSGGPGNDYVSSIAVDINGNSFISGYYNSSSITLGGTTLTNLGGYDSFVSKIDSSGNFQWGKDIGGTGDDFSNKIKLDNYNNCYLTGYYGSSSITNNGVSLINNGGYDIFNYKIGNSGSIINAVSAGSQFNDYSYGLAFDSIGNIFICGSFEAVSLNLGSISLGSNTYAEAFIAQLGSQALPVELTSFCSQVKESDISLNWQTQTEVNCNAFEVERINLGTVGASDIWERVAFVPAHGNSNSSNSYQYCDKGLAPGKYLYRLKVVDNDGSYYYSYTIEVDISRLMNFSLSQNYPNPFNPNTTISYNLPVTGIVVVKVYNSLGQEVATLVNETQQAGNHTVKFNAGNMPSGIYSYTIRSGNFSDMKKMILIK